MIVSHKQKAVCSTYDRYIYHQSHTYAPIFPYAPFSPSPFHLVGAEISRASAWGEVLCGLWCTRKCGTDCNVFAYAVSSPPSRPLGSLTPTQPGRVINSTQGCPGPPWEALQAECWLLGREPKPPA